MKQLLKKDFIEQNLTQGEDVLLHGNVHYIVFMKAALCMPLVFSSYWLFFGGVFLYFLIPALIEKFATEIAITNKRVVTKCGFISRGSIDVKIDKIEGVICEQSVVGRILNYGNIVMSAAGEKPIIFHLVSPFKFRKQILELIDN